MDSSDALTAPAPGLNKEYHYYKGGPEISMKRAERGTVAIQKLSATQHISTSVAFRTLQCC